MGFPLNGKSVMMMNFIQVSGPANKGTQFLEPLGTLSNYDDSGGSENITKRMNLRPFKLYRVYLEPRLFLQLNS